MHNCIPLILPPGSASGHKLQKSSKESGIFHSLAAISLVLFYQKAELKGGHSTTFINMSPSDFYSGEFRPPDVGMVKQISAPPT